MFVGIALIVGLMGGYTVSKTQPNNLGEDDRPYKNNLSLGNERNDMRANGLGNGMGREGMGEPNRGNCLADDCLLVDGLEYPAGELTAEAQGALMEAINDEYKALATYQAVTSKFGSVRPFSMIMGAEEQHIASLKAIFTKYGLDIPENTWSPKVNAPETLKEACQLGVDAEVANAALYREQLLPAVTDYEDVTLVFNNLMNASQQKHLAAFEKCN